METFTHDELLSATILALDSERQDELRRLTTILAAELPEAMSNILMLTDAMAAAHQQLAARQAARQAFRDLVSEGASP